MHLKPDTWLHFLNTHKYFMHPDESLTNGKMARDDVTHEKFEHQFHSQKNAAK